jgi:hypothetical protein
VDFDRVDCFDKLSVRIPRSWVESSDEEDNTCGFFDSEGDSGTLRVSLITRTRNSPVTTQMLQQEDFDCRDEEGVKFFVVDDEHVVAEWEELSKLEVDTHVYLWTISAVTGPLETRQAIFSYAVSGDLKTAPDFSEHLEMVRDCVFATAFVIAKPN